MQRIRDSIMIRICIAVLLALALVPPGSTVGAQENEEWVEAPLFGVHISWTENWIVMRASSMEASSPESFDIDRLDLDLVSGLEHAEGREAPWLTIEMYPADAYPPEEAVLNSGGYPSRDDIIDEAESDSHSMRIVQLGPRISMNESYLIDDGTVTVSVKLIAYEDLFEDALAFTQDSILINGSPVLIGEPINDSGTVGENDGSAEIGTASITRTPRAGSDSNESEPIAESDTEITRTPRTGNTTDEDAEEPAEEVVTQAEGSYTGPTYGYSIEYDPAVWTLDAEIQEGRVDGVRLVRENSTYTIWAWDAYGNDPLACLEGEVAYYSTQHDSISDWEAVLDTNGEPVRYESEAIAWGVFNLNYTSSTGETRPLIDYISCEPIPGQDAVLIVLLSADPGAYNTELDYALDVLDTLQFGEATDATTETDPVDPVGIEIDTNLAGSVYTSPIYGYTAEIPLEWQILDESIDGNDERLVLGNGTSVVTLWATDQYAGDLAGCVDFAAGASGLNLELDSDASGGDFRGVYRNEAFANFVYEQDGDEMMYFINCQAIPGTNGYLILIHDVEYDQFTNERRSRSDIENSVVMP